jgi:hypothetical protein
MACLLLNLNPNLKFILICGDLIKLFWGYYKNSQNWQIIAKNLYK